MLKKNKPALERIIPEFGSSFTIKQYFDPNPDLKKQNPFWHFHPELELVYINGGSGNRHIDNHLSYFYDGDLIFIGSNLPHYGFTDRLTGNQSETVVQMKADFLGQNFFEIPEMQSIDQLFQRAKSGISFYGLTKERVGQQLEQLTKFDPFERLLSLLTIFKELAYSGEYRLLNAEGYIFEVEQQDNDRANIIYSYVRKHFKDPISLSDIASLVNMTEPSFCRYFKKLTAGKTFTGFVNEFRVVYACKLLVEESESITEICFKSGFNNFSHFSRLFRKTTGKSPSEYRKHFKRMLK